MKIIEISVKPPFIKLEQFLKFAALCDTGGQAKILIHSKEVCVNGEICEMRGKKLIDGDVVTLRNNSEKYKVLIDDNQ